MMTVEELNGHVADGSIDEVIRVAETRQKKILSKIADDICQRPDARVVLITGGSSSGKTTTTKRLCTQLRVNERECLNLSTDDYFVGDARNPRDKDGNLDYEHMECVDIKRLTGDIKALLAGEAIHERKFDFVNHVPTFTERMLTLAPGAMVTLEGIHALNPLLTEGIGEERKYRVYIEPKPSLDIFGGITPKAEDSRFLRRLVRDRQFRKIDTKRTLEMWPKVLAGEKRWVEPFKSSADVVFDSYLVYELAVLKFYAGGLLELMRREIGEVRQVMNMIRLLRAITPIDATKVPGDSILRETIGGSQLEY